MINSYNSGQVGQERSTNERSTNKQEKCANGWPSLNFVSVLPSVTDDDVEAQLQAINHMRILTISSIPHRYE